MIRMSLTSQRLKLGRKFPLAMLGNMLMLAVGE